MLKKVANFLPGEGLEGRMDGRMDGCIHHPALHPEAGGRGVMLWFVPIIEPWRIRGGHV